jgi:ssDNA thymidine ADP-ribosyltransferase, DarT
MGSIKERRLSEIELDSHPGLFVGQCVPFYFCPRSVMLYLIHQANHCEMTYREGQELIVHLELDLQALVGWAQANRRRWAFTLSNAGSFFFEERADLARLEDLNWVAIDAQKWSGAGISSALKEGKQAESLVEERVPWQLVQQIGVHNPTCAQLVADSLPVGAYRPPISILRNWYY